ncbi:MAG: hypothetical protein AAGI71_11215 [Bacteroidota bacterium]
MTKITLFLLLCLGLCWGFTETAAAQSLRLGAFGGFCFDAEGSTTPCPIIAADVQFLPGADGLRRGGALKGGGSAMRWFSTAPTQPVQAASGTAEGLGAGVTLTFAIDDKWPPRPGSGGPSKQGVVSAEEVSHGGTLTLTGEAILFSAVTDRYTLEPFLGGGMGLILEGDGDSGPVLDAATVPAVSYGLGVTARVRPGLDLRVQFRGEVYLADTLDLSVMQDGERVPVPSYEVGTVSTSSLLFGLAIRL